jgi:hypothetical protein
MVGLVEQFDEFVVLLKQKLSPLTFDPRYRVQNVSRSEPPAAALRDEFRNRILEANQTDLMLYAFVRDKLVIRDIERYGRAFDDDVARFRALNSGFRPPMGSLLVYDCYKRLYLDRVSGVIRRLNGLPAKGSYGAPLPGVIWDGLD